MEVSKKVSSGSLKGDVQSQDHADMAVLRKELSDRSARLEEAMAANAKLSSRLKMTEGKSVGDLDERSRRQLDKIAGLTTKCEQLEADCHVIEARYKDTNYEDNQVFQPVYYIVVPFLHTMQSAPQIEPMP